MAGCVEGYGKRPPLCRIFGVDVPEARLLLFVEGEGERVGVCKASLSCSLFWGESDVPPEWCTCNLARTTVGGALARSVGGLPLLHSPGENRKNVLLHLCCEVTRAPAQTSGKRSTKFP